MSALAFLKRFIARPTQVASLVPSSKAVTKKVADRFDFSQPRVFVEFGPGEGCHTRELLKRATPDSKFFLFELDPELARLLVQRWNEFLPGETTPEAEGREWYTAELH